METKKQTKRGNIVLKYNVEIVGFLLLVFRNMNYYTYNFRLIVPH